MLTTHRNTGFTLVELVTTIIVIAILSVVVVPRLFTSSSYSAFTLREEFIAELRKVQMMALNNQDRCYQLKVTATNYQVLGFEKTCTGSLVRTDTAQALQGGAMLLYGVNDSFSIEFDAQGVPKVDGNLCNGQCISVKADETQWVAIESEGYIHAG
ncbi:type II secretion system protein [Shewanella youngdeokensis]|uniref:Type II secretion system protein n=1 Tax=Shewanella youngdeokensis TaxID=2999068 RepID=A0ABZ0JX33_9GAMM|nr:type II secretion system protein [Shewanella sp. DAU334]